MWRLPGDMLQPAGVHAILRFCYSATLDMSHALSPDGEVADQLDVAAAANAWMAVLQAARFLGVGEAESLALSHITAKLITPRTWVSVWRSADALEIEALSLRCRQYARDNSFLIFSPSSSSATTSAASLSAKELVAVLDGPGDGTNPQSPVNRHGECILGIEEDDLLRWIIKVCLFALNCLPSTHVDYTGLGVRTGYVWKRDAGFNTVTTVTTNNTITTNNTNNADNAACCCCLHRVRVTKA